MEEKELQNELASIRSIMERSSKFISLSGLSGILAGVYALIAAGLVGYFQPQLFNPNYFSSLAKTEHAGSVWIRYDTGFYADLLVLALIVLIASITTALILSRRQAKRKGQPMWGKTSKQVIFHMAVPLFAGGALMLIHFSREHYGLIAPSSLIFYGIALVSASNFTFGEVKYLGLCEIILGLIAAWLPGYGLLFWALGFGVLHIIYGARIYFKYDK